MGYWVLDGEDAFKQIFEDDDDLLRFSCFLPGASFFSMWAFFFFSSFLRVFPFFLCLPFSFPFFMACLGMGGVWLWCCFWVIISFCSLLGGREKNDDDDDVRCR